MTDTSLALHLFRATAPNLTLDDCENVLEALSALGYRIVASDAPGERAAATGDLHPLAKAIARKTPVHYRDALLAFAGLHHLCFRIKRTNLEIATK